MFVPWLGTLGYLSKSGAVDLFWPYFQQVCLNQGTGLHKMYSILANRFVVLVMLNYEMAAIH